MNTVENAEGVEDKREPSTARDQALRIALADTAERAVSDGILAVDRRGHVVFVNPRFLAFFQLKAETIEGASSRALVDAIRGKVEDPRTALAWMRQACKGGDATTNVKLRDGSVLTVVSLAAQGASANGAVLGRVWIVRDAAQAGGEPCDESDKGVLRALNQQDLAGTFVFSPDGTIDYINPKLAKMFGYGVEETLGRNFMDFVSADTHEEVRAAFQHLTDGRAHSEEISARVIRKDGGTANVVVQWSTAFRNGKPVIIGVALDMSALNEARESLAASEGLYGALVAALSEGVLMIDAGGRVVTCNEAAARTLGYTQDEIRSRNSYDPSWNMVHEDLTPLRTEEHPSAIALRTGRRVHDVTMGIRRRDGELRWVNINAQPLFDKGEAKPRAAVVSFFDVTVHKQDQDRLMQVNHALAVLSRANETVVRSSNEHDLLDEMCRVLTATGYRLAWIGLQTARPEGVVRPVAAAGGAITLSGEADKGGGTIGLEAGIDADAVLASGKPQIVSDLTTQTAVKGEKSVVPESGARIVLPLRGRTEPLGVLVLYADRPDAFGADEERLLVQLAENLAYGIGSLRERAKIEDSEKRLRGSMEAAVQAVASTLEMRDPYTAGHQRDVARLAVAIAHEVGVPEDEIEGIYLAAIVHDIGKIRVPIDILNKPGALTDLEHQLIQTHAQIGYDIIKHVDFPWPVARMILQHHERLDGSGYPAGLKGPEILQGAKIIAVADVVQAMSMRRPYRGAFGDTAALEEIQRGRGSLYDPAAVDACLKLFREKGFRFA